MKTFDWILDVRFDFPTLEVAVRVDPARLDARKLIDALADAGFEGSTVKTP